VVPKSAGGGAKGSYKGTQVFMLWGRAGALPHPPVLSLSVCVCRPPPAVAVREWPVWPLCVLWGVCVCCAGLAGLPVGCLLLAVDPSPLQLGCPFVRSSAV
jgi:hypothetical protein